MSIHQPAVISIKDKYYELFRAGTVDEQEGHEDIEVP